MSGGRKRRIGVKSTKTSKYRPVRSKARCPETGKIRLRDKREAVDAIQSTSRNGREEKRYYKCGFCKGWHLTSAELIETENKFLLKNLRVVQEDVRMDTSETTKGY